MEQGTTDPTPDLDDLYQEETDAVSVPVRGEGTFLVQQLPARRVQYATDLVAADWVSILPETPKRARATLVADRDVYVSHRGMGGGMLLPAGVPLAVTNTRPIVVRCANVAGPYGDPEIVTAPNPGLGAGAFAVTVPAGETWQVVSVRYAVATSAAVANRFAEIDFRHSSGPTMVDLSASTPQAASSNRTYNWYLGAAGSGGSSSPGLSLPEGFPLSAGSTVTGTVFGFDPGDAITEIVLVVRKSKLGGEAKVGTSVELWAD